MVTRTFLDKTNTIIKDSTYNYGLHPISMLNYGGLVSRILIHFDIEKLKGYVEDKTYYKEELLSHVLRMKNCGSINPEKHKEKMTSSDIKGIKERATSFTLIAFEIPQYWDEGVGFDNANDFWLTGKSAISEDGSTWYNSTNEETWGEEGIYSNETLEIEYQNFKNGLDSIIIAEQHFDHGNENIEMDITNYVNKLISGEKENNGICIAFLPLLEEKNTKYTQYVGFFNNKTNTIFNPVLETRYNCDINDDRMSFILNKENELYLYSFIDGKLENLDRIPSCKIENQCEEEIECLVDQETKGIYSATVKLTTPTYHKDMILYDIWTDLFYNGKEIEDVELEFVTHPSKIHFSLGNKVIEPKILNPMIVGINDNEKVNRGETRLMKVFFRVPYTNKDFRLCDDCWYKIYVKDGDREVTIIDWDKLFKMDFHNFFMIKTDELIPTDYHVDIKADFGDETRIFKDILKFRIVSKGII